MGQLLGSLKTEIAALAEADGYFGPDVDNYFPRAWNNINGREELMHLVLSGEADAILCFIVRLAKLKCYGCLEELPSQRDHDYCLEEADVLVARLFDEAWDCGLDDVLKTTIRMWIP